MGRKSGNVIIGVITAEFIQKKEWIQHIEFWTTDDTSEINAGTVRGFYAFNNLINLALIHFYLDK
jgi:hypothetical protein